MSGVRFAPAVRVTVVQLALVQLVLVIVLAGKHSRHARLQVRAE